MKIEKVNESYSTIESDDKSVLMNISNYLKAERSDIKFNKRIQYGLQDKYVYFTFYANNRLYVPNGLRFMLEGYGISSLDERSDFSEQEIDDFLSSLKFPFEPYDYQLHNIKLALTYNKMVFKSCTGSGKSLTISTILEFFRQKNLKGVLIVPNINLLTQFKSDIESYGFDELNKQIRLFGNGAFSEFDTCLTITTWQSLQNVKKSNFDYIIVDEAHKTSADVLKDIVLKSNKTKIKLGFTGTLPEDKVDRMTVLSLFGKPKTIITSRELIDRGLATPIKIKTIFLNYSDADKDSFWKIPKESFMKQLSFIENKAERQNFIVKLAVKLHQKNTLVLFQHTEQGKDLFRRILLELYPNLDIKESDIVGKDSFEFQKEHKVFFMNGEQNGKIRELQRKQMEIDDGVILIANYAICSTGINIKNLHNLVFASPLKAFTTISQSLGRLMRKHKDKKESVIYDLVDDFGYKKHTGLFYNQYKHRLSSSYVPEEFEVEEKVYHF